MKTPAIILALLPALLLSLNVSRAQTLDEEPENEFWDRFEVEFGGFMDRLTTGFLREPQEARRPSFQHSYGLSVRHPAYRPLPWISEQAVPGGLLFRYNRVEGLFFGLGSDKKYYWNGRRSFSPFGSIGYGFASHRWRGNLGVTRQFSLGDTTADRLVEVGVEGYSLTDSKDQWLIPLAENNVTALFIHEDFRDYFGREGVTAHAAHYTRTEDLVTELRVAYLADRYRSLDLASDWAIFGGKKRFRPNPAIDDGRMRSILLLGGMSTASQEGGVPAGWTIHTSAEFADPGTLGGEFKFQQYLIDLRRYQPLSSVDNLRLRLRIGSAHGMLPQQRSYELGGLGTLPGFPYKDLPADTLGGNRMILANAEYRLSGDFLDDLSFWPSGLLRHIAVVLLADAGLVRRVDSEVSAFGGFDGIRWNEFRSDFGIGLTNTTGSFRIALVWRTDRAEAARLYVRITQPF